MKTARRVLSKYADEVFAANHRTHTTTCGVLDSTTEPGLGLTKG